MIEAVVAPFDHSTVPSQPLAVNVADSPLQSVEVVLSMVGVFTFVTTMVTAFDAPLVQSPFLHTAV